MSHYQQSATQADKDAGRACVECKGNLAVPGQHYCLFCGERLLQFRREWNSDAPSARAFKHGYGRP